MRPALHAEWTKFRTLAGPCGCCSAPSPRHSAMRRPSGKRHRNRVDRRAGARILPRANNGWSVIWVTTAQRRPHENQPSGIPRRRRSAVSGLGQSQLGIAGDDQSDPPVRGQPGNGS